MVLLDPGNHWEVTDGSESPSGSKLPGEEEKVPAEAQHQVGTLLLAEMN